MKATVSWQSDMKFVGETDTGKRIEMDGEGSQTTPMEAVLLAVGACSSIDVVEILKKSRQAITGCECQLDAQRADDAPRVFTEIHAHYVIEGENLSEKHIQRAVQLSAEKYCSVMLMLEGKVKIKTSFSIAAK
ncbi:OsmC family protein [Paraglaciecola polaris]|uniref:Protein yhfA n=1 Tax=Paraglaciecola polaris LMG 21857 TaxID=1129793 RepID=K7AI59_9ALTE|nr:OsmC family protein [Paraglaciecola polaris]GAC34935.1 protein yhfA [Paraglaciecola polaris LMG 21857]|tara:strand:+ start:560 stop:958 length:399 start_codon:yes stop_codon:yes gene_type:complete